MSRGLTWKGKSYDNPVNGFVLALFVILAFVIRIIYSLIVLNL